MPKEHGLMKKPWLVINSTGGPALLAILGAAVTLWPPETWEIRAAYFAAFLVVGIISVVSAVRLSLASGREIDTLISGGDNFCFFRIEPSSANIRDGQFQLMMEAIGGPVFGLNYWICPASANRDGTDPAYSSLDTRKPLHPIIHRGVTGWDRGLPVGEYFIGFDARNGGWNEELKIFLQDGKPRQTIIVRDKESGEVLYDSEVPRVGYLRAMLRHLLSWLRIRPQVAQYRPSPKAEP
jgi:hypothetical protein